MTTVGVSGAAGRMGRLTAETIAYATGFELAAAFDPDAAGGSVGGVEISATPEVMMDADVVVEFTTPDVVMENLRRWHTMGRHAVVGTSGFGEERLAEVESFWSEGSGRCLIVPNFSIGAVVMMRLAEIAAPHFDAAEVIEMHHDRKADAPSGTALATAERIARAAGRQKREVVSKELRAGTRGAEVDGVFVHAVRLPGLVAHQAVMLGGLGETLTIRHDTTDREAFMPGVVLAVRKVADLPLPVTVGLDALLGI
ncbi:MAG: 4-hydroxy-tetrahydrodipicolinate reductase [Acidimicrobiia bacterium]|nr:4-hydroxy-tetrahydrodipicolinate reductase [Acidimicrobiia bacterium]